MGGCNDYIMEIISSIEWMFRHELYLAKKNYIGLKKTYSYRLGHFILYPLIGFKQIFKKKF